MGAAGVLQVLPYLPGGAPPKVCQYVGQIKLLRSCQLKHSWVCVSSQMEHFLEPCAVLQANTEEDRYLGAPMVPAPSKVPVQRRAPELHSRNAPVTAPLRSA